MNEPSEQQTSSISNSTKGTEKIQLRIAFCITSMTNVCLVLHRSLYVFTYLLNGSTAAERQP